MIKVGFSVSRCVALIRKEFLQMIRDGSTLVLGVVLPMVMLLLFGFGLSLDVEEVPVTVVKDSNSPAIRELYTHLDMSRYFSPRMVNSMEEAKEIMREERTDAIVRLGERIGGGSSVQIILNGRDSNKARITQRYLEGAVRQQFGEGVLVSQDNEVSSMGRAAAESRIWYNHSMESKFFLVPGVIVLVMTLIGALLTSLVVAREWERGTYEALAATPMQSGEFLMGKVVPYFMLGLIGLGLCLAASYWVFEIPMRGGLGYIVLGSALYLMVALGIGLLISSVTKSQFLASQMVVIISFLPTLMLSGFVFDLNVAFEFVYYFAHVFPATWYVDLLQTLFLVGDVREIMVRDFVVLAGFAFVVFFLVRRVNRKSLE